MKFIIKLFPEVTLKSQSVRLSFIKILTSNIRNIYKECDESVAVVVHYWDYIKVRTGNEFLRPQVADTLGPHFQDPSHSGDGGASLAEYARYLPTNTGNVS